MTVSLDSMSICSGLHSSVLTHFICLNLERDHQMLTELFLFYQTFISYNGNDKRLDFLDLSCRHVTTLTRNW